ncbi:hypothetical protein Tco_0502780 [Tanacetum coccineum]
MPPRRFKKKSVRKIVEKHVAKAIEEYEKTRAESNNADGSRSTNTGETVAPEPQRGRVMLGIYQDVTVATLTTMDNALLMSECQRTGSYRKRQQTMVPVQVLPTPFQMRLAMEEMTFTPPYDKFDVILYRNPKPRSQDNITAALGQFAINLLTRKSYAEVRQPVEIMDREVKWLKQSRFPIVKVRWNSRQGAEYTWEHEDQFRMKYPHLFSEPVPSSNVAT